MAELVSLDRGRPLHLMFLPSKLVNPDGPRKKVFLSHRVFKFRLSPM